MPYLPAPGIDVLSPSDPLTYIRARLREGPAVEEELFDDMHILEHLSEGHQRACERSQATQAIATIALGTDQEHDLPDDCHRVLSVYVRGWELELLADRNSLREGVFGYYVVGDTIGFRPLPSGETAWVHYVQTPAMFEEYTDTPTAAFGPELYYALVHYVRWKARAVAGGSQGIAQAQWERDQYDLAVALMRRRAIAVFSGGPSRFVHVLDRRRPRRGAGFANDVDAR